MTVEKSMKHLSIHAPRYMSIILLLLSLILISACSPQNPTAAPSNSSQEFNFQQFDLKAISLKADDLIDFFPTASMAISQGNDTDALRIFKTTYPTNSIAHTLSFSEGFETTVELYRTAANAQAKFNLAINERSKTYKNVANFENNERVFIGDLITAEGVDTGNREIVILVLNQNALITMNVRGPAGFNLPESKIRQLIDTINGQLKK